MSMSFSQAKVEIQNSFEGGVSFDLNWADIFHQASKILSQNINPRNAKRRVALYGGISADLPVLTCPRDIAKPAGLYTGRQTLNNRAFRFQAPFAFYESTEVDRFTIDYINGIPFILVRGQGGLTFTLSDFTDPTIYSGVTLTATTRRYIYGAGALSGTFNDSLFNVTWSIDSSLQNMSAFNNGIALVPFHVADVSKVSAVRLRLSTDVSNYFTLTSTADSIGDTFINGWNLARFDMLNKVATGSPVMNSIASAEVEVEMMTGESQLVTIDAVSLHQAEDAWFEYYSTKLFKAQDGTLKEKPSEETDIVDLDDQELDIFLYEVRRLVVQDATYDGIDSKQSSRFDAELLRKYEQYNMDNPSSQMPMTYNISADISKEFDVGSDL